MEDAPNAEAPETAAPTPRKKKPKKRKVCTYNMIYRKACCMRWKSGMGGIFLVLDFNFN